MEYFERRVSDRRVTERRAADRSGADCSGAVSGGADCRGAGRTTDERRGTDRRVADRRTFDWFRAAIKAVLDKHMDVAITEDRVGRVLAPVFARINEGEFDAPGF